MDKLVPYNVLSGKPFKFDIQLFAAKDDDDIDDTEDFDPENIEDDDSDAVFGDGGKKSQRKESAKKSKSSKTEDDSDGDGDDDSSTNEEDGDFEFTLEDKDDDDEEEDDEERDPSLPKNFKSVKDLAKAHKELERKLTEMSEQLKAKEKDKEKGIGKNEGVTNERPKIDIKKILNEKFKSQDIADRILEGEGVTDIFADMMAEVLQNYEDAWIPYSEKQSEPIKKLMEEYQLSQQEKAQAKAYSDAWAELREDNQEDYDAVIKYVKQAYDADNSLLQKPEDCAKLFSRVRKRLKALGKYDELIEKNQRTKKVSQVKSKVSGKSGTKRKTDEETFLDEQFPEE